MKDDTLAGYYVMGAVINAEYFAKIKGIIPKSLYLGEYETDSLEDYFGRYGGSEFKTKYMPKGKLTMILGMAVCYVNAPSHLAVE